MVRLVLIYPTYRSSPLVIFPFSFFKVFWWSLIFIFHPFFHNLSLFFKCVKTNCFSSLFDFCYVVKLIRVHFSIFIPIKLSSIKLWFAFKYSYSVSQVSSMPWFCFIVNYYIFQ